MTTTNSGQDAGRSPFGELLLRLRTARGFTQELLAQATSGDRISPRSITHYEAKVNTPQKWVVPHRPALRLLAEAMDLDLIDQRALVMAWDTSRKLREAKPAKTPKSDFITAGREKTVQVIMDAWQQALFGTPQVVFLGGTAGIGKSALARHISDQIASSTKKVMISWGGASSWATDIEPYLSVRSATDRILVPPDASSTLPGNYPSRPTLGPEEISHVIESIPLLAGAIISERALRDMDAAQGNRHSDAIDSMLAARASTESIGRQEEYFRLLSHLAQVWPVVIVLEDLHWAGDQTVTLLLHLARQFQNMRDRPILFICTFRNDELSAADDRDSHPLTRLLDSIGHAEQVSIVTMNESMSPAAGMAFVRGMIAHTPIATAENLDELAEYLYDQTSGHPLLTGELKRHLLETKALVEIEQGKWEFHPSRIPDTTPSAISTFIGQRLKRVSRDGRRILDVASVMNDVILPEIIAETMDLNEEDILETINQELVATHQLLLPGTPVLLLQRSYSTYRFPHALFREQVYNGLADSRRKRLHLAIAEAMERNYTDADSDTLSEITSHYVKAEEWQNAQVTGFRLAQHASYKLDWDLARIWFTQAEELAIQAQDPQQLWLTRAARLAMLRGTGEYDAALELGERILKLVDGHDWPNTFALAYHHLGEVYYDLGQVDKAVDYLGQAITLHNQQGALDLAAAGEAMLSHATYRQGKYDVARMHAQNALKLSRDIKNSWVQPEAVLAAANCEIDLGFYKEAIENYQMAMELATMVGKLQNQFIPAMNIGLSHTLMGNHQQAIDYLTALIEKMESRKILRLTAPARLYLGFAHEAAGNLQIAAESYQGASEIRRSSVSSPTLFDSVAGEMRTAMKLGHDTAARKLLDEITDHLNSHGWEGIEYPLIVKVSVARAKAYFGDTHAYAHYIKRAYALLMERAEMIEDSASRDSYLTNVPSAVEVQDLYAEL